MKLKVVSGIVIVLVVLTFFSTMSSVSATAVTPPVQWQHAYGGWYNEIGESLKPTADGGYIVSGLTLSSDVPGFAGSDEGDAYLLKIKADGTQEWHHAYGGVARERLFAVLQAADGGYIAAGVTASSSIPGYSGSADSASGDNIYLLKVKADGTQEWHHAYGGTADERADSIEPTADGGYIVSGFTVSSDVPGSSGYSMYLIKVKADGTPEWQRAYGGASPGYRCVARPTADGGYIISSTTTSSNVPGYTGAEDVLLFKVKADGTPEWQRAYGGASLDTANSIARADDGGYIVSGYSQSLGIPGNDNGNTKAYLLKVKADGTPEWHHAYLGYYLWSVKPTADGGYIGVGLAQRTATPIPGYTPYSEDAYVLKVKADGTQEWHHAYGGAQTDFARDVLQTADGGYIVSGVTYSANIPGYKGNADAYIIKLANDQSSPPNRPPTVEAGPDKADAHIGDPISLEGKALDPDGGTLTNKWSVVSQPTGSQVAFSADTSATSSFTANMLGTYVLRLTATDSKGASASDTVSIIVINQSPTTTITNPDPIYVNKLATFVGSESVDPDGQELSYSWSVISPGGGTVQLTGADTETVTFTPSVVGVYTIKLTVTDSEGATNTATVMVSTTNVPPVADARLDQPVTHLGATVQLDGSQSYDNDGNSLTYAWTFVTKPEGSQASFNDAGEAKPSFTADVHGDYVIQLIVNDGTVNSNRDTTTVSFENIKPTADGGTVPVSVVGQTVTLNGKGSSDANGDALTYKWTLSSTPDGSQAQLTNPTSVSPTFVPDKPGTYVAQLIVNDGFADSDANPVEIQVITQETKITTDIEHLQGTISSGAVSEALKNPTMTKALTNKLNAVTESVSSGNRQAALDQLNEILAKTDGCKHSVTPDKNDWVTTCDAQNAIHDQIVNVINEVQQS